MGLVIDSGVFILWERSGRSFDFSQWSSHGEAVISVITVSELLVGVNRADTVQRREKRSSFVEGILSVVPTLPITSEIAREHARLFALLSASGETVGAHDLWIGATAIRFGYGVLTTNFTDFKKIPGLDVVEVVPPASSTTNE